MKANLIPVSFWRERELVGGKIEEVFAMVLRTQGCRWARKAGCLMCGYRNESSEEVTMEEIVEQVRNGLKAHKGEPFVKIYTSGSFLDDEEIAPEARVEIMKMIAQKASHVLVETRPEFARNAIGLKQIVPGLEVALGLESANEVVLSQCVRKGAQVQGYIEAMDMLRSEEIRVRCYLLLKPPFLTEAEAIEDCLNSIQAVAGHCDVISINPVNVQKGTFLEKMFLRQEYRPPWFWSLFEVIKRAKQKFELPIISHPSGAGKVRSIHNCRKCDEKAIALLTKYNLSQNPEALNLECECHNVWKTQLEVESALRYSPYIGE